jgi:hypothetical protein
MKRIALILLAVLATGVFANNSRKVILQVIAPESAWSRSKVAEKLIIHLSRDARYNVIEPDFSAETQPPFPEQRYNLDSLMNWGTELGGRYLMLIDVHSQRLETRKTFQIPLFFHKYQTMAVMEGEFRCLDLSRGRMLVAEPFRLEEKGPRCMQADPDENAYDSDLQLPADQKILLLDKLEEKLADHLSRRLSAVTNGR